MRTLPRPASAQPGDPPSIGLRRGLIRRPRAGPNLQVRDPFCRRGQLLRRLASRQCFGRCSRLSYQHLHFLGAFVGAHFCPVHKSRRQANDGDGGNRRPGRIVPAQDARYSAHDAQEAKSEPGDHPGARPTWPTAHAESTPIRRQSAPIANRSAWSGVNDLLYSFRLLPKSKMRETPSRKHGRPHKKRLSVLIPHPESTDGSQIVAPHHPTLLSASGKGLQFL